MKKEDHLRLVIRKILNEAPRPKAASEDPGGSAWKAQVKELVGTKDLSTIDGDLQQLLKDTDDSDIFLNFLAGVPVPGIDAGLLTRINLSILEILRSKGLYKNQDFFKWLENSAYYAGAVFGDEINSFTEVMIRSAMRSWADRLLNAPLDAPARAEIRGAVLDVLNSLPDKSATTQAQTPKP